MTVDEIDKLTRKIQAKVYLQTGVILTGVGVYSFNTSDDEISKIRNTVQKTVMENEWALQLHGFYVDTEKKTMRFDVVVSFDVDRNEAVQTLTGQVQKLYPDYSFQIVPDIDA